MNGAAEKTEDDLVVVARVARPRGLRGEVFADLLTDFPERFDSLESLIAVWADGRRETLRLAEHRLQGGRAVFKFAGRDSLEQAQQLVNCELAVPEAESVALDEDEFFHWELEDCAVETVGGRALGRVKALLETGAAPILVVGDDEHLIPLAAEICVDIDVNRKLIRVDPPEGLLEK